MFIHDVIKLKFVLEGYLPNYPYHLISDEEMCDAFLTYKSYDYRTQEEIRDGVVLADEEIWERFLHGTEPCYFRDNYPYIEYETGSDTDTSETRYKKLVDEIEYHIEELKTSLADEYVLPDWIYSYMLGRTIGVRSSQLDIHEMLVMMGVDNLFDEYRGDSARECYRVSKEWLSKLNNLSHRPPTMFGEPHVMKSLRLRQLEVS